MDIESVSKEIVEKLTLEEKASLLSGRDFWTTKTINKKVCSIMLTDGPHGVRKQSVEADHLGLSNSVPATCFPTASATACSFNRQLMYEMGAAIAEECCEEDVAVLLGPGVNIKRSPLCGRNFEYCSEDPYLTGEMAGAFVKGVQSRNVGTSLKHFTANNQEKYRLINESVVDERAMREIYLAGFEKVVKDAAPWTVMCAYNQCNGTYMSENKSLLTDVLRTEWGYRGLVVSDWGAVNDRVEGVKAGMDLEMPYAGPERDAMIISAVRDGALDEKAVDRCAERVVALTLKAASREKKTFDRKTHHDLARRVAADSCVLLKNTGDLLPIETTENIAVIGEFAKEPRYQGAGSSKINPIQLDTFCDVMDGYGIAYQYAPGYSSSRDEADEEMISQACEAAGKSKTVILFLGLPVSYESEGFDRDTLEIPPAQVELIKRIHAVNDRIVTVVCTGSVVDMDWERYSASILLAYLAGAAGAAAVYDILFGGVTPSGKLAESWPIALADTPCYAYYPGERTSEYRESIFVGYRYYETAKKPVRYPFGYGLSYTDFTYRDMCVSTDDYDADEDSAIRVRATIRNTGSRKGAEVVQLYVGQIDSAIFKAARELKGFEKVELEPGEEKEVEFTLDRRAFAHYDTQSADWAVEPGHYIIMLGSSVQDILVSRDIKVHSSYAASRDYRSRFPGYYHLQDGIHIPDEEFASLYGRPLPAGVRGEDDPFTMNSTLPDIESTVDGYAFSMDLKTKMLGGMGKEDDGMRALVEAMVSESPLRFFPLLPGGMLTLTMIEELIEKLNGSGRE